MQVLLKMEKLQDELTQRFGSPPTFAQWAAAAGVDQKTLRKQLNYGVLCKDKMIKSNIRLVISIAKNYQGAGMNLQDLVQVLWLPLIVKSKVIMQKIIKLMTYISSGRMPWTSERFREI